MAIKLKMYKTLNYFRHRWQNGNKAVIILITITRCQEKFPPGSDMLIR